MKKLILFFICSLFLLSGLSAQEDTTAKRSKIAVFAPLYLDSAFDVTYEYRYAKTEFPKFINPGLEFYEGVQLALDSMERIGVPIEVFVYDTRSATQTLAEQLERCNKDSVELILTYSTITEVKAFADSGLKSNIPVININMPNDGGVSSNPFYVILNPTLRTQIEGIYRHIQKYYSTEPLVIFRKKGPLEDRIRYFLDEFGKQTLSTPLKLKYVDLPDSFTVNHLKKYLDTIQQTVCIAGTMDENFGKRLVAKLAALKKESYKALIIGMPTWDVVRDFRRAPEYKGIEIVYSTPFYNPRTDSVSVRITEYFDEIMYSRPSDMVMRGYEAMWRFGNLLTKYKGEITSNLSRKEFNLFREFDIQPVINRETMMLDYFENKKLFFLKWQDGILKAVY